MSKKETLAEALAAAQNEMINARNNAKNPHFRSDYADLSAIRNAVIPHLSKYGIALVQIPGNTEKGISIKTVLKYRAEEMNCGTLEIEVPKGRGNPAQAMGSALSYARRYSMASICAVASSDDDDGNSLHESTDLRPAQAAPKKSPPKKAAPKKAAPKKAAPKKADKPAGFDATAYPPLIEFLKGSAYMDSMGQLRRIFDGKNPKTGKSFGEKWKLSNWGQDITDLFIAKMRGGEMPEVMELLQF